MSDTRYVHIEIPEIGYRYDMPLDLAACNEEEYIRITPVLYALERREINIQEFQYLGVYALLNLEKSEMELPEEEKEDAMGNIAMLGENLGQFFYVEGDKVLVKRFYTGNHVGRISSLFRNYYGPADFFTDVTWGEYEDGLNVFFEHELNPDPELLIRLAAIFFRPKRFGKRIIYNEEDVDKRIKRLKSMDMRRIIAFYFTFAAFHLYLSSSNVRWEGRTIDLSIIFNVMPGEKKPKESEFNSLGTKSQSIMLANTGIFGNYDTLRQTNLWKVMLVLYDMRKSDLDNKPKDND
ncbi:hypothetical protein [Altibacter sp. HG106]|uniref:hypothetical protein n=1 Tax=Altibacter sp. HG106 TaxID=3023937 RepID=UPI002350870B|nr:hypothetical protein [Altibacter sp. HG106]MDC7994472.1 hypothetical protein [Altibacter sp. HG106]